MGIVCVCVCVLCTSVVCAHSSGQVNEVCDGVREYFNAMLGAQLLYKFERPQYSDVRVGYMYVQRVHTSLPTDTRGSSRHSNG